MPSELGLRSLCKFLFLLSVLFIGNVLAADKAISFVEWSRVVTAKGLNAVRVQLVANDAEWEELKKAIEEVEQALEPPTDVEGFWARKAEVLRHPVQALNLKRSFQNILRLAHVSKHFESPWLRDLMLSSAMMLALTHGGEFVVGMTQGTSSLSWAFGAASSGDTTLFWQSLGQAGFWYGMALPGLYDFACHLGQAALFVRPTRIAINESRKFAVLTAGRAASRLGLDALMEKILKKKSARERLLEAFKKNQNVDFEFTDEELLTVRGEGYELSFVPGEESDLELKSAVIDIPKWAALSQNAIKQAFKFYGWNVWGAIKQIDNLLTSHRGHLIEHEKTFVSKASIEGSKLHITFREHAVRVTSKWEFKGLNCAQALKEAVR